MGYEIRGLVCAVPLAESAADRLGTKVCDLAQGLALVPVPRTRAEKGRAESDWGDPVLLLTDSLEALAETLSVGGTVAYVEAEFFADQEVPGVEGHGAQAAALWRHGSLRHGPYVMTGPGPRSEAPRGVSPINHVLRRLGVVRTPAELSDEFDALGLGRHQSTERWLSSGESSPTPERARPKNFRVRGGVAETELFEDIALVLMDRFGVTAEAAVAQVDDHWSHFGYLGRQDIILHESPAYWAKHFYYGPDSLWGNFDPDETFGFLDEETEHT